MLEQPPIPNFEEIRAEYFISDFIVRSSDGIMVLYIPKDKISNKARKGFVSLKQLDNLKNKLKKESEIEAEIVLLDADSLIKIGEGFVVLLKATFQDIITDAQVSFLNAHCMSATIELAGFVESSDKETIEDFLRAVLAPAKISLQAVQWDEVELPSLVEIITIIKIVQPVKLEEIHTKLLVDYHSLQKKWLNTQLDKLVKKHFIVREKETETYITTSLGLNVLPKIISRNNSDIVRALDLGRRKW